MRLALAMKTSSRRMPTPSIVSAMSRYPLTGPRSLWVESAANLQIQVVLSGRPSRSLVVGVLALLQVYLTADSPLLRRIPLRGLATTACSPKTGPLIVFETEMDSRPLFPSRPIFIFTWSAVRSEGREWLLSPGPSRTLGCLRCALRSSGAATRRPRPRVSRTACPTASCFS